MTLCEFIEGLEPGLWSVDVAKGHDVPLAPEGGKQFRFRGKKYCFWKMPEKSK